MAKSKHQTPKLNSHFPGQVEPKIITNILKLGAQVYARVCMYSCGQGEWNNTAESIN